MDLQSFRPLFSFHLTAFGCGSNICHICYRPLLRMLSHMSSCKTQTQKHTLINGLVNSTARIILISTGQMAWLVPVGLTGAVWPVLTGGLYNTGKHPPPRKMRKKYYKLPGGSHTRIFQVTSHKIFTCICTCTVVRIQTHGLWASRAKFEDGRSKLELQHEACQNPNVRESLGKKFKQLN